MWSLETIVAVNDKIGEGKTIAQAFAAMKVHVPSGRQNAPEVTVDKR